MVRLSLDEVQKVLRLAAAKGIISPTAGPTAGTVADAFGLAPYQIEQLLDEVRARKAEAPQWRKLGAIAAAVGVVAILAIGFTGWQAATSRASAGRRVDSAPMASAGGPSNYRGAMSTSRPTTESPGGTVGGLVSSLESERLPHSSVPIGQGRENAVLAQNRYTKTDSTDLNGARSRVGQHWGAPESSSRVRPSIPAMTANER